MAEFHVAQINIARMLAPIEDPVMADFCSSRRRSTHLAEKSPGFVWRLQSDSGDATGIKVYDDDRVIINLTVGKPGSSARGTSIKAHTA